MDWNAVEAIAEVVGILLVAISLVFLAFQVRQNTHQLRQDNLLKTIRGTLDTNWYFHRDPEAFRVFSDGCESFDQLSDADKAHFHSILMDLSFYLEMVIRLHQSGLVDRSAPEINSRYFLGILVTPGGAQWWDMVKSKRPMPQQAIDSIDAMLQDPDRIIEPITDLQPWFAGHGKESIAVGKAP